MQLEQMKEQNAVEMQQTEIQADVQKEQAKAQAQAAVQQHLNELENQRRMAELQGERELAQFKANLDAQVEQAKIASAEKLAGIENDREILKARIAQETAIEVARIGAAATDGAAEDARAQARDAQIEGSVSMDKVSKAIETMGKTHGDALNKLVDVQSASAAQIARLHQSLTSEKEIVRDPKTGKAVGMRAKPSPKDLAKAVAN